MTSSASSTERNRRTPDAGLQPWHFYMLLAMGGATWAVIASRQTSLVALLTLSAAVLGAGVAAVALHYAMSGFFGAAAREDVAAVTGRARAALEREKSLIMRSIKELEFDRAMGKVSDADFADINGRLRARAVALMQALAEREPVRPTSAPATSGEVTAFVCDACGTTNDADARFCKQCGAKL